MGAAMGCMIVYTAVVLGSCNRVHSKARWRSGYLTRRSALCLTALF